MERLTVEQNWPLWKRLGALHSVLMFTSMVNFSVIGLAPGFGPLAEEWNLNSNELTWLISAPNIGQFIGCFAFAPLANTVGRRPIWLGCALVFLVANIWAASANSYGSLMVARIVCAAAGKSTLRMVSCSPDRSKG